MTIKSNIIKYSYNSIRKLREYKNPILHQDCNENNILRKDVYNGLVIYTNCIIPNNIKDNLETYYKKITKITEMMNIHKKFFNLFYQNDSNATAFNKNGSLFFNIKYMNLEENDDSFVYRWLIIICHELAHNNHLEHNSRFLFVFQEILRENLILIQA